MHRRILQLGSMILPNTMDIVEDEQEGEFGTAYAYKDGAAIYQTRPAISAKEITLKGTFFNSDTIPGFGTVHHQGVPVKQDDFVKFIHWSSQKCLDLFALGIDNRIYRLKVRVGLPNFTEYFINGFDWSWQMTGYETYWEDVTDRVFYDFRYCICDGRELWPYAGELDFYRGDELRFELVVLDPPANFSGQFYNYRNSMLMWDSNPGPTYTGYLQGAVDNVHTLQGAGATEYTVELADVLSYPNLPVYQVSDSDILDQGHSFIYTSTTNPNAYNIKCRTIGSLDILGDFNTINTSYDTYDINVFVGNKDVLETLKMRLQTNSNVYREVDLLPQVVSNRFVTAKFRKSDFLYNGSPAGQPVNRIVLITKDNGTHTQIKINRVVLAQNFGLGMQRIPEYLINQFGSPEFFGKYYVHIPNITGKVELCVVAEFPEGSTGKRLTINERSVNLTASDSIILVKENKIFTGPNIQSLVPVMRFNTLMEKTISITVESNIGAYAFYSLSNKFL